MVIGRLRPVDVLSTRPALQLYVSAYAALFLFALVAARYYFAFSWPARMHEQYGDIFTLIISFGALSLCLSSV